MVYRSYPWLVVLTAGLATPVLADSPSAEYIFPAGGQRGTTVEARVGGLNLNSKASFEMLGPGVEASAEVRRIETVWFEGPLLPLPDSQQVEDYPKDYSARITIAADAPLGSRAWRLWTSQGTSGSLPFFVGDLPEVIEHETSGDPVPEPVSLPVTINGRIFPREDVDLWTFPLSRGQVVTATVDAGRLGSPLDPWVEALDPGGRRVAESAPAALTDARLAFTAPRDGTYTIKIHDVNVKGGQGYVYRLTLTTGPSITRVFPLGGRRGESVSFAPEGPGVGAGPEPVALTSEGAGQGPKPTVVRFAEGGAVVVEIDDLPAVTEAEPNNEPAHVSNLEIPGIGDGRIGSAGDVDIWAITLTQGRSYDLELRAARLGSSLDGVLSLTDPTGKELVRSEGDAGLDPAAAKNKQKGKDQVRSGGLSGRGGDPAFTFEPTITGRYLLRVQDRFRSRGGSASAYRLRVSEAPAADFRLVLASNQNLPRGGPVRLNDEADTLTVPRGGTAKLKVEAECLGGFAGPIALEVEGLPEGISVAKTVIAARAASADLTFKAEPSAPIRSVKLTIRGTAEIGGHPIERVATRRPTTLPLPEIDTVRLAVALPTPFLIKGPADFGWSPRGTVRHRHFIIERNGFLGPVEVRLADRQARHLQGVTGPVLTIPTGTDEFDYSVTLPSWMEIGRTSRSVVVATGVVREPDGTEHEVSFSSTKNEVQCVAVIGPGVLGLEARRSSLALVPEQTLEVPIKVARGKGVSGPVHIDMIAPGSVSGVSAEPLVLKEGQDEGVLRIVCGRTVESPRTAQVVLKASSVAEGEPVTAEAPLTLVFEASGTHGD